MTSNHSLFFHERSSTRNGKDETFWSNVMNKLSPNELSTPEKKLLNKAIQCKHWVDMLPKGLVSSYLYIYSCVKGLNCEDADVIERDVLRTVGAVKEGAKVFRDTSELGKAGIARAMHRLLTAISIIDDMGYCQGMNYIVDFMLKIVSEEEAFVLFLYALRNRHLCCLYETKLPVLSEYMEIFELELSHLSPELYWFLKHRGFAAPFYSIEWFTTLFTLTCPPELTHAIWDLFFIGVKDIQLRCALAIMDSLKQQLISMSIEELLKDFRSLAYGVNVVDVIVRALTIQLLPVRVSSHNESRKHGYLIDPRIPDDNYSCVLLQLRVRYANDAIAVMKERAANVKRWAANLHNSESVDCKSAVPKLHDNSKGQKYNEASSDFIDECEVNLNEKRVKQIQILSGEISSVSISAATVMLSNGNEHTAINNLPSAILHRSFSNDMLDNNYEVDLLLKVSEMRDVISTCGRIVQWMSVNKKWSECIPLFRSELSRYNLADHMLRYSIVYHAHIRVIEFFLSVGGADPNSQDRWLCTPLHFAAAYNRPDVLRLLLLCGADPAVVGAIDSTRNLNTLSKPEDFVSTIHLSSSYWPPALIVLRGRSCISCNSLFSSMKGSIPTSREHRELCSYCDVSLCLSCLQSHICIWSLLDPEKVFQYRTAVSDLIIDFTIPKVDDLKNDSRFGVSSKKKDDICDYSVIDIETSEQKNTLLTSGIGVSFHDVTVLNEVIDKDKKLDLRYVNDSKSCESSQGPNLPQLNTDFGKNSAIRKLTGGQSSSSSQQDQDLFSAFSKQPSNSLDVQDGKNLSALAMQDTDQNIEAAFDMKSKSLQEDFREINRMVTEAAANCKKVSKNSRFSFSIRNNLRKLKEYTRRLGGGTISNNSLTNDLFHVDADMTENSADFDKTPQYWVGYKVGNRLQPWQILLLPQIFGAEENWPTKSSNYLVGQFRGKHNILPKGRARSNSSVLSGCCGKCGQLMWKCMCQENLRRGSCTAVQHSYILNVPVSNSDIENNVPESLDFHGSSPKQLYFFREMEYLYMLLKRDYSIFGIHTNNSTLTTITASSIFGTSNPVDSELEDEQRILGETEVYSINQSPLLYLPFESEFIQDKAGARETSESFTDEKKRAVLTFLSATWTLNEKAPMWMPDECSWHCTQCTLQFTLFQRKHHCRRCGGIFCNEHAPLTDILYCLPNEFLDVVQSCDLPNTDRRQFRLCDACATELKNCVSLCIELDSSVSQFTLTKWENELLMDHSDAHCENGLRKSSSEHGDEISDDLKEVKLKKFLIPGTWMGNMAELLWKDKL